eukprot:Awhi_evm1s2513
MLGRFFGSVGVRGLKHVNKVAPQVTVASLISNRSYASFVRSKPHCNIGTIGHVDHGKT